jgi:hypothetical protein
MCLQICHVTVNVRISVQSTAILTPVLGFQQTYGPRHTQIVYPHAFEYIWADMKGVYSVALQTLKPPFP